MAVVLGGQLLAACGGGSGSAPPPAGIQDPPPPPPPDNVQITLPALPNSSFVTSEFRNNWGLRGINIVPAYEAGGSGQGVTVGIFDNGFNAQHPDLINKIHPASTSLGSPGLENTRTSLGFGHGTILAGIIGAAKNDDGIHGVAYDSQILAVKIDNCPSGTSTCDAISMLKVVRAIDIALANDVKILGLAIGAGSNPDFVALQPVIDAFQRAVDAGLFITFAAANFSQSEPDPFASHLASLPGLAGSILIVGNVSQTQLDASSNRAGSLRDYFVVAPGTGTSTTRSGSSWGQTGGTSAASPHVAGAAAVLLSLFPNLTGRDLFDILTTTATDFGDPGVDDIFGHGLINVGAALQPLGLQVMPTLATIGTTSSAIPLSDTGGGFSVAFGDALINAKGLSSVMMLDGYNRSYTIDLRPKLGTLYSPGLSLANITESRRNQGSAYVRLSDKTDLAVSLRDPDQRSRPIASALSRATQSYLESRTPYARFQSSLGGGLSIGLAFGYTPANVISATGSINGNHHDFLSTDLSGVSHLSLSPASKTFSLDKQFRSGLSLQFGFATGKYEVAEYLPYASNLPKATVSSSFTRASYRSERLALNVTAGAMLEDNAVLGSISSGSLSLGKGAGTAFLGVQIGISLVKGILLTGQYETGWTNISHADYSFIADASIFRTSSFAVSVSKSGLLFETDRIGFAVHQPLRAEGGALSLKLPTGRDYSLDRILFTSSEVSLAPTSRQIDLEISYRVATAAGFRFEINLVQQLNPGHSRANGSAAAALFVIGKQF